MHTTFGKYHDNFLMILLFFNFSVWIIYFAICLIFIIFGFPHFFYSVILGDKKSTEDFFQHGGGECYGDCPKYSGIAFLRELYGFDPEHPHDYMYCRITLYDIKKFFTLGFYKSYSIRLEKDSILYKIIFYITVISLVELISTLIELQLNVSTVNGYFCKVTIALILFPIEKKLIKNKVR